MLDISFRLMFHHEWMLLILISKMYYSECRKRGSLLLGSLVQRSLRIVRHTSTEQDRRRVRREIRERVLPEERAIEFQRRVSNVKETIVINTKDNPKY
jgi:hypothetical protein